MMVGVSSGLANSVTMINYVPCKLGIDLKPLFGIRRGFVRVNTRSEFRNDVVQQSSLLESASVSALEALKISAGDSKLFLLLFNSLIPNCLSAYN